MSLLCTLVRSNKNQVPAAAGVSSNSSEGERVNVSFSCEPVNPGYPVNKEPVASTVQYAEAFSGNTEFCGWRVISISAAANTGVTTEIIRLNANSNAVSIRLIISSFLYGALELAAPAAVDRARRRSMGTASSGAVVFRFCRSGHAVIQK